MRHIVDEHVSELIGAARSFRRDAVVLARWGRALAEVLTGGGRLLVAGNGGSAAEAQHLTAELVGKLREDRVAPDAPVPVLAATGSRDRPGGAALAAALAVDRDIEVTLVAPVPEGRRWGPRARPARGVRGRAVPAARPRCP